MKKKKEKKRNMKNKEEGGRKKMMRKPDLKERGRARRSKKNVFKKNEPDLVRTIRIRE